MSHTQAEIKPPYWLLPLLGIIFTVLQAVTTYYIRNADTRLNQIATKLDQTRELSIETRASLSAHNQRLTSTERHLETLSQVVIKNQQDIAVNRADIDRR